MTSGGTASLATLTKFRPWLDDTGPPWDKSRPLTWLLRTLLSGLFIA